MFQLRLSCETFPVTTEPSSPVIVTLVSVAENTVMVNGWVGERFLLPNVGSV